jgi:hypothetical protein
MLPVNFQNLPTEHACFVEVPLAVGRYGPLEEHDRFCRSGHGEPDPNGRCE